MADDSESAVEQPSRRQKAVSKAAKRMSARAGVQWESLPQEARRELKAQARSDIRARREARAADKG